jgi:hypothetical protein
MLLLLLLHNPKNDLALHVYTQSRERARGEGAGCRCNESIRACVPMRNESEFVEGRIYSIAFCPWDYDWGYCLPFGLRWTHVDVRSMQVWGLLDEVAVWNAKNQMPPIRYSR